MRNKIKLFKTSSEYFDILTVCESFLNKEAEFSCYVDGIFEYHIVVGLEKHIFCIIADDDFIKDMSVEWLLDLKRVSYFSHEILLRLHDDYLFQDGREFNTRDIFSLN